MFGTLAKDSIGPVGHLAAMSEHYLKEWRELAELTQEQLGRVAGLGNTAVNKIEKGTRALTLEKREKFAAEIGRILGIVVHRDDLLNHPPDRASLKNMSQFAHPQVKGDAHMKRILRPTVKYLVETFGVSAVLEEIGKATKEEELPRPLLSREK